MTEKIDSSPPAALASGTVNLYAPPKARVDDAPSAPQGEPAFFPVSLLKLTLMSIVTFNLFLIYWFYKNWKSVQRLSGDSLNAPVRAFFYVFTAYWLFGKIRDHGARLGVSATVPAGPLALLVFVLAMTSRLPDPYWLVTFLDFLPLLPAQSAVNRINRRVAPDAEANSRFGGWNIFGLVGGGLLFALAVVGAFMDQSS